MDSLRKMGSSLIDLQCALHGEKNLTPEEEDMLACCLVVGWLVTPRLLPKSVALGALLPFGIASACGQWKLYSSVESSFEGILSLEGSRAQRELANIMLKNYPNDPWVLQRLHRHFYLEEVQDESSVDRPTLRWRVRNFADPITYSQSTSYSTETDSQNNAVNKTTTEPFVLYESESPLIWFKSPLQGLKSVLGFNNLKKAGKCDQAIKSQQ
ncbi:hypothetical protein CDL12_07484 [Handroanthus impetiginosus]|uniref:Uncharacterized protein n=1 Tax=Handroanthus impetiginosus TaxID=429701 RepID=A0A2G9HQM8_9LAMI|nr:hypothetical protein CDL12_07484 [Handroanthus impetiginosus]